LVARVLQQRSLGSLHQAAALDPVQEALLAEPCILVDRNDRVIGEVGKESRFLFEDPTWEGEGGGR
jgi:hypothetical protein